MSLHLNLLDIGEEFLINVLIVFIFEGWLEMGLVILQTKSKSLRNILLLILVVKEDFAVWRKALDTERSFTCGIFVVISLWIELILVGELLLNFDKWNLVWLQFLSHVHLIIRKLCQISCKMKLFEHIRYNIREFKFSLVPNLCSVSLMWQLKSGQLVINFICLVVNDCNKLKFLVVTI